MAGKRKNKTSSKARRQTPRFFPPPNTSETPNEPTGSQDQLGGSENQAEATPSQAQVASIQFGDPPSPIRVKMPPIQPPAAFPSAQFGGSHATPSSSSQVPPAQDEAASLRAERDRLNLRMKDNAWNRALLSTQIKQTQRDIMRTKLLGEYDKRTGDLLSEFILKLHKRDQELIQLEAEQKILVAKEEKAKK